MADVMTESGRAAQAAAAARTESDRAKAAAAGFQTESERAEQAAADLKNTAPDIFAAARTLLSGGKIDAALEKIGMAISLDETTPTIIWFEPISWKPRRTSRVPPMNTAAFWPCVRTIQRRLRTLTYAGSSLNQRETIPR